MPSHYLNQCCIIVNWTLRNKLQWNFSQKLNFSFKKVQLKTSCPGDDVLTAYYRIHLYFKTIHQPSLGEIQHLLHWFSPVGWVPIQVHYSFPGMELGIEVCLLETLITSCEGMLPSQNHPQELYLTHWGWDKMAANFLTTFSNAFSWMKMYEFQLRFHRILFLRVQLTISHHWFR